MATLIRYRVLWSGTAGGPGVTTLYGLSSATQLAAIRTFFNACAALLPSTLKLDFPGNGDTIDDTTGAVNGGWAEGTQAQVAGSNPGTYAAPAGAEVVLQTGGIVNRRRVKGRIFLVPMVSMASDGTLAASAVTTIQAAASTLFNPANFFVYSRPKPITASNGTSHTITAALVPDKAVILRSRRD